MNIDALTRAVGRLRDTIVPVSDEKQERLRYIEHLHGLTDDALEELRYQEQPELRPTASKEELIQSFLSIDIDTVPESLLRPDLEITRVNYNDIFTNRIEHDRVDVGTVEQLQRWHVWKQQNFPSS